MAIDQFANWRKRVKGEFVPIVNEHPDPGFYRNRGVPVAYWIELKGGDGSQDFLRCHEGGREVTNRDRMNTLWSFAVKEPVTKAAYDEFNRTGTWPDQSAAVTLSNQMPVDDNSIEGLTAQINMLANEADMLMKKGAAQTQIEADHAADVATRLGELHGKADKMRVAEKAPHLAAERAVDDRWRPIITTASIYSRIKAAIINPFLIAENTRREKVAAEAAAKALADATERARLQREADDAARLKADTGAEYVDGPPADQAPPVQEPAYVPPAPLAAPPQAFVPATAGTRGRVVSGRKKKIARIDDYAKALGAFAEHPNIRDEVQRLANAQAKIGIPTAGCEIVDDPSAV